MEIYLAKNIILFFIPLLVISILLHILFYFLTRKEPNRLNILVKALALAIVNLLFFAFYFPLFSQVKAVHLNIYFAFFILITFLIFNSHFLLNSDFFERARTGHTPELHLFTVSLITIVLNSIVYFIFGGVV